ncbi:condensation domain-containing protein [Actinomadura sp. DC4]|uniref:condensation domain-containing protein n=1 Tax=Actinomadura sp. DC4 TaxID=3055069 RepID=UPI0025B186DE|nr:condensation domain-containing protein [Actinomadura sp. DC4]MDN3358510.1 condensation domain-containing protein [Actinomadura sp. DC4]
MAERKVPMAPVQLEMWHAEQATRSARENVYCAFKLHGRLDVDALGRALAAVVARHEPLRTRMVVDEEPVQLISDSVSSSLEPIEVAGEAEAIDLIRADADTRIPLDTLPLWRISLVRLPDGDHILGLVFHHIVVDGWSVYVFLADLGEAYGQAVSGRDPSLAPLPYTYSDYCHEERYRSDSEKFTKILAHWRKLLPATPPELHLPRDGKRIDGAEARADALDTFLDASATAYMNRHARASRCTVFTLILDAVGVTLAEHGDTDQVTVGVPFHNRVKREQRPLVGFIANMLPMTMTDISRRGTDHDRLDYAKSVIAAALRYPSVPPEVLMRELYGLTDPEPLTFCLNVESPQDISYGLTGIDLTEIPVHNGTIFHDFELTLMMMSDHAIGDLTYDADLYSRSRADALWTGMKSTLIRPTS